MNTLRGCQAILISLVLVASTIHAQDAELARGAELLAPFKQHLKKALKSGLATGPVEAIQVCRVEAPEIAKGLSVGGVRVGRSSHKLRNPDNWAPEWVSPVMQAYLDDPSSRKPHITELGKDKWGYVEPIMVQPLCLTCHGSDLPPDIAIQIADLYPEDRAVGFEAGDLRGVFWLEFPRETQ